MESNASRKLIAERAGVSKTTVTRVLAGSSSVSAKTRKKVMSVVDELGYTQNVSAANLSRNKNSNFVAMLVPDMTNYYYLEMFDRIVSRLEALDYTISVYKVTKNNYSKMLDKIIKNRVSAIINLAFIPVTEEYLKKILCAKIKIIHPGIHEDPVKVEIDYTGALREAFGNMIAKGCRRFRFLCGTDKNFFSDGRISGYLSLMKEYGFERAEDTIVWGRYPDVNALNEGYSCAKKLSVPAGETLGVFCLNDMMALGAIKAFREAKFKVGREVFVVGCDNILLGEYSIPSLSTIDSSVGEEAERYVDYILGNEVRREPIRSKYISRDSAG